MGQLHTLELACCGSCCGMAPPVALVLWGHLTGSQPGSLAAMSTVQAQSLTARVLHQVGGENTRSAGGGKFSSELEVSNVAVAQFQHLHLGQVRSLAEAQQDPEWQQEVQHLRSLAHDTPAAVQPPTEQLRAEPPATVGFTRIAKPRFC